MKMKLDSLTRYLLVPYIVLLTFSFVDLDASASQSKVSGPPRLYSCSEVKELYPKFEKLSREGQTPLTVKPTHLDQRS